MLIRHKMGIPRIGFIILTIALILSSCRGMKNTRAISSNHSTNKKQVEWIWQNDKIFDVAWYDTLQNKKSQVKNKWEKESNVLRTFSGPLYEQAYNLFKTKEDCQDFDIMPIEVFTMDIVRLQNMPSGSTLPIDSFLILNKDKAMFFIVKNKKFYYRYNLYYNNEVWQESGYGPIFKDYSDTLTSIIFEKKYKVFTVYIPRAFTGREFIVYKINNTIMNIGFNGKQSLFKDALKEQGFLED